MTQVSFISAGTAVANTGVSTLQPTYPGSPSANDLIILQVAGARAGGTSQPTTPTGFDLQYGPDDTGTVARQFIYSKISNGTESGTITINDNRASTADVWCARMYLFRNNHTSAFLEAAAAGSATSNSVADVGITTLGNQRLAVNMVAVADNNAINGFAGETGGDWTEQAEFLTSQGIDFTLQVQAATMTVAGTIDGGTTTITQTDAWIVRGFAIIQASTGAAGWANIAKFSGVSSANLGKIYTTSTSAIAKINGVAV